MGAKKEEKERRMERRYEGEKVNIENVKRQGGISEGKNNTTINVWIMLFSFTGLRIKECF